MQLKGLAEIADKVRMFICEVSGELGIATDESEKTMDVENGRCVFVCAGRFSSCVAKRVVEFAYDGSVPKINSKAYFKLQFNKFLNH